MLVFFKKKIVGFNKNLVSDMTGNYVCHCDKIRIVILPTGLKDVNTICPLVLLSFVLSITPCIGALIGVTAQCCTL